MMEETQQTQAQPEQEEMPTTDDVLKELHSQTEDMGKRYGTHVKRLLEKKDEAATKGDVAELYHAMSSDVVSLVGDVIAESAAAFREVGEMLESDDDDEEDDELSEENIELYLTIRASINAFEQLATSNVPNAQKEAFHNLLTMNQNAAKILEEQYGDEIKAAFAETLKQAQEGNNAENKEQAEKEAAPTN